MKPPWQVSCQLTIASVTAMPSTALAGLDRNELQAEFAAGGVVRPHGIGAGAGERGGIHRFKTLCVR